MIHGREKILAWLGRDQSRKIHFTTKITKDTKDSDFMFSNFVLFVSFVVRK